MSVLVLAVGRLALTAEDRMRLGEVEQRARRDADDESVAQVVRNDGLQSFRMRAGQPTERCPYRPSRAGGALLLVAQASGKRSPGGTPSALALAAARTRPTSRWLCKNRLILTQIYARSFAGSA